VNRIPQIAAHRVTHVVSLAAVAMIVVAALAFASADWWVYALVILILAGTIVALILYPQLGLENQHLYDYVMARLVGRISPETSQVRRGPDAAARPELAQQPGSPAGPAADHHLENRRIQEYQRNRGLFLGHYWRPSEREGQKADIRVQLRDHPAPEGILTALEAGTVESVTYQLGPKFSEEALTKSNRDEDFALDFSAYGPLLCLAEVNFNDRADPLYLSRYIDFPEDL
jgi:hypothetical protein